MTAKEMREKMQRIFHSEASHGISAFAYIDAENGFILKKFVMTDDLRDNVSQMLDSVVEQQFLSDETELDSADNIADNRKILYEIVQNTEYSPFPALSGYRTVNEQYSENDQNSLVGFFYRVNVNEESIWLYQQVYQSRLVKRNRSIYAALSRNHTYELLQHEVLKIESRVDFVIIGNSIITSNITLMQSKFGFDKYVRSEASATIELIKGMEFVQGIDILQNLASKDQLTTAKKLMKAKHSPVLRMEHDILITAIRKHHRYKEKFIIESDCIVIKNQKDAKEFLKMLNDDIVRSDLTNQEYDSSTKTMLDPVA